MIVIERHEVEGLPFLEVVNQEIKDKELPTVFFYHGWTNCKEAVIVNGYEVARKNMRAIIPDAMFHGERSDGQSIEEHFDDFANIVMKSVDEFGIITDYLKNNQLTDRNRIGVTGLSMGGITTCAIMARYSEVKAADCLMGAPNFYEFVSEAAKLAFETTELPAEIEAQLPILKEYDLSLQPEKIAGRPFHFWHGTKDDMVPYEPTFAFYEKEKKSKTGAHLTFTTTDDGHRVPYKITLEMADYFSKVL